LFYALSITPTNDDLDDLKQMLSRYAGRYYTAGTERNALVAQTMTVLADDPELLLGQPIEKAVAVTMHHLFIANPEPQPRRQQQAEKHCA
jgi:hypothetical protein